MANNTIGFQDKRVKRSLRRFWLNQKEWSERVFGASPARGPDGALKHLKREVQEAMKKPKDLIEYADMMHLVFDACRRAGYNYDDLVDACYAKLALNVKGRTWGKPDAEGVCEHVEPPTESQKALAEDADRERRKQQALEDVAAWHNQSPKLYQQQHLDKLAADIQTEIQARESGAEPKKSVTDFLSQAVEIQNAGEYEGTPLASELVSDKDMPF